MADPASRHGIRYATPELLAYVESTTPCTTRRWRARSTRRRFTGCRRSRFALRRQAAHVADALSAHATWSRSARSPATRRCAWRALPPGGKLVTFEIEPSHAAIARDNIAFAGGSERVEVLVGTRTGRPGCAQAAEPFDAVFLDADKSGYPDYARGRWPNLRRGGLLIADNTYYFGQLLGAQRRGRAMREFHGGWPRHFDTACVPTPDGTRVRNSALSRAAFCTVLKYEFTRVFPVALTLQGVSVMVRRA